MQYIVSGSISSIKKVLGKKSALVALTALSFAVLSSVPIPMDKEENSSILFGSKAEAYSYTYDDSPYSFSGSAEDPKEILRKQVLDSLNKTGTLPETSKIEGRVKNEDGSYSVMIRSQTGEDSFDTMVVDIDENGFSLSESAKNINLRENGAEAEKEYQAILAKNDLSEEELDELNSIFWKGSKYIEENLEEVSEKLNISKEKLAQATTGMASLLGTVILGAGETKKAISSGSSEAGGNKSVLDFYTGSHFENYDSSSGEFTSYLSDDQYYGMTEATRKFINILTSKFYDMTGIVVNLTSGYRPFDTGSYHSIGIAFDVCADEFEGDEGKQYRDLYCQLASELGGSPLDEYPGEEGERFARGSNIHVSVHNQDDF